MKSSASRYDCSGLQFFRTTTGIQSGPGAFDELMFVMTFSTTLGIMEILCNFRLVLEGTKGKGTPQSSRLEFLANNFALSDAEDNTPGLLNRGGIADLPLLRTLVAIRQKFPRAKFLGSDGLFCFCSICKLRSFKNPFVTTNSQSKLYFRFKRFVLLT